MIVKDNSAETVRSLGRKFAVPNLRWQLDPGGLSDVGGGGPRGMKGI